MRTIPLLAGTLALVIGVLAAEVSAAELKVLSAGAMRAVLQELASAFETASGHKLKIEYATAGVVEQKVAADDEIDVAILTKPRIDKLVREAKIVGGTMKTLASAQIGVAVKKGAAKPDISSVEAFKRALLNAKSVAYADPATGATSGAHLAQAIEGLPGRAVQSKWRAYTSQRPRSRLNPDSCNIDAEDPVQLASSLCCSAQSNGRSSSVRRVAVSATGCRPCRIESTSCGLKKARSTSRRI
jgi:hypothetical protein